MTRSIKNWEKVIKLNKRILLLKYLILSNHWGKRLYIIAADTNRIIIFGEKFTLATPEYFVIMPTKVIAKT